MDLLNKITQQKSEVEKIFLGKSDLVNYVLIALTSGGHILLEDVPGVGKTSLVKLMAKFFGLDFNRIQFTNDLLPSDIIGTNVFNKESSSFNFYKGPVFTQVLLGDELNRASSRTQSALLQVMEEKQVTLDGTTYQLDPSFIVMATQNPREQLGTNFLPESQLDRFFMKLKLGFAEKFYELELLKGEDRSILIDKFQPTLNVDDLLSAREQIKKINVSDAIFEYIYALLEESRNSNKVLSLSSRCGRDLLQASKALAWLKSRDYTNSDDVKELFPIIAGHRLVNPQESNVDLERELSTELLAKVSIP
jgi:MoxR-like ATPase